MRPGGWAKFTGVDHACDWKKRRPVVACGCVWYTCTAVRTNTDRARTLTNPPDQAPDSSWRQRPAGSQEAPRLVRWHLFSHDRFDEGRAWAALGAATGGAVLHAALSRRVQRPASACLTLHTGCACLGAAPPAMAASVRRRRAPRGRTMHVQAAGSTFGTSFRVTTFGESHGGGVGCVIDGVPPRLRITQA